MMLSRPTSTLLAALCAVTLACSGGSSASPQSAARADVSVAISPGQVQVAPGATVAFAATVSGAADTSVTWSVQEASGGTVDAAGVYQAPQGEGTYHVVARSVAEPSASGAATVTVAAGAPAVAVRISPSTATVDAGGSIAFTATVTGTTDTRVGWTIREASGCGSITAAGQYTAPGAAATCHVVATSVAAPAASQSATVTVNPPAPPTGGVALAVSPSSAAISSCQSATFTATVTGTTNTAVSWAVQEGAAGGTVTAAGVYTGPAVAGTYHVVATSQADTTRTQVMPVVVTDRILSVAVSPPTTSLAPGQAAQFTATVTTTCGTFTSTATVTAPATAAN